MQLYWMTGEHRRQNQTDKCENSSQERKPQGRELGNIKPLFSGDSSHILKSVLHDTNYSFHRTSQKGDKIVKRKAVDVKE